MTIVPGYGTDAIHLGQTSSVLRSVLGPPTRRRKSGSLREYWVYSDLNFEAIVSQKTGRLLSLFFHLGSPLAGGRLLGLTEEAVYRKFTAPSRRVKGFPLTDDQYLDSYLAYDAGISFFIGKSGKVKTVVVSSPKRKYVASKQKPKHVDRRSHGMNLPVAAMQLR
jgi:hypothetical protein